MKLMKNKRGVAELANNAIGFVVAAITIGIAATIIANIQSTQTAGSIAYNASTAGLQSLGTFSDNLGTLALVVVFGIILFYLGRYLLAKAGG